MTVLGMQAFSFFNHLFVSIFMKLKIYKYVAKLHNTNTDNYCVCKFSKDLLGVKLYGSCKAKHSSINSALVLKNGSVEYTQFISETKDCLVIMLSDSDFIWSVCVWEKQSSTLHGRGGREEESSFVIQQDCVISVCADTSNSTST